jgi:hypothetical protein
MYLPDSAEYIKFFISPDIEAEYQELVSGIVAYMSNNYYGLSEIPRYKLTNGSTTERAVGLLQTLMIDIDIHSDEWRFRIYNTVPIPYVRFHISSSSRISPWKSKYMLDQSMDDGLIANNLVDTASGFDGSARIRRKNRGCNIFALGLPSSSMYGKEKWIYAQLKGLNIPNEQSTSATYTDSPADILYFLESLGLSEEVFNVKENEHYSFLNEKDKFISNHLGEARFSEMIQSIGIDPDFYFGLGK